MGIGVTLHMVVILEDKMLKYIIDFLDREKTKNGVELKNYPNGIKYLYTKYSNFNCLHCFFYPLTDEQINKLQHDVNQAQNAQYIFPDWYCEFLKTSNGLRIFFNAISFYGEQTPMINHPKYGWTEAPIERSNPEWLAPYNLRYPRDAIRVELAAQNRWLTIGAYFSDGTKIAWDFKKNKIVLMYPLSVDLSVRALRKMKEADYEALIFAEYESLEVFFYDETERLNVFFDQYKNLTCIDRFDVDFWKKTLHPKHKEYQI